MSHLGTCKTTQLWTRVSARAAAARPGQGGDVHGAVPIVTIITAPRFSLPQQMLLFN